MTRQLIAGVLAVSLNAGIDAIFGTRADALQLENAVKDAEDRTGRKYIKIGTPSLDLSGAPQAQANTERSFDEYLATGCSVRIMLNCSARAARRFWTANEPPLFPMSAMRQATAHIALGSNLGDRQEILLAAVNMLRQTPGVTVRKVSRFEMTDPDSFEILLPNHRGELTEGSLSNLFLVDGEGRLLTPSPDCGLLLGITREHVMRLARDDGIEVLETRLLPEDLMSAREAFLTASTLEIMPIARVGGHPIGDGRPGPVTRRLQEAYRREVREYCERRGS